MICADTTDMTWLHRPHIYAALAATDDLARAAELLATCGMIYSEKQLGTYRTRGAHLVDQARELGLAERFFAPPESAGDASAGMLWQQPDTDTDADTDTGTGGGMPEDAASGPCAECPSAGTLWQQPGAGHADTDTDADADTGTGRGMPADAASAPCAECPSAADDASADMLWQQPGAGRADTDTGTGGGMFADGGGGQDASRQVAERERECGCGGDDLYDRLDAMARRIERRLAAGDWLEKTEVDLVDRYLKLMAQLIEMRDRGRAEPARHDSAPPLDELLVRLERAGAGGMHDALRRAAAATGTLFPPPHPTA